MFLHPKSHQSPRQDGRYPGQDGGLGRHHLQQRRTITPEAEKDVQQSSKVWLHFIKQNDNKVKSNVCGKLINSKSGCTSKLTKHLTLRQHGVNQKDCTLHQPVEPGAPSHDTLCTHASSCIYVVIEVSLFQS